MKNTIVSAAFGAVALVFVYAVTGFALAGVSSGVIVSMYLCSDGD